MDNREFSKVLLFEATDLLESAGRNGQYRRIMDALYKEEKYKNDKADKETEHKRKQYEKAGYADKAPSLSDRRKESNYKQISDELNDNYRAAKRGDDTVDSRYRDGYQVGYNLDDREYHQHAYDRLHKNDDKLKKQKAVHGRINDRAKRAQHESIAVLLTEAALLLNDED